MLMSSYNGHDILVVISIHVAGAREEIVDRELIGNEESLKQEVSLVGKAVILHITDREFESPTSYPHTHYLSASLMRHILINASCSLMNVPAGTDAFMFDPII